jgi:hypothetical protein
MIDYCPFEKSGTKPVYSSINNKPLKTTKSKFVMKKLLIILSVLIAGSPFVSCKKMKDDIKDLQNQANDLQKQNDSLRNSHATLKNQLDGIASAIGSDEPIAITTTFQDNNGATRTISGTYKFKSTDYYTQSMYKNNDGTYEIYIERFNDITWNESVSVGFTYNPTTKAVTSLTAYHYWDDADSYSDYAYYYGTYSGLTKTLTIDNFDVTTGAISLKFSASGTGDYTNSTGNSPNPGKPVTTNFTFAGKLKLFSNN